MFIQCEAVRKLCNSPGPMYITLERLANTILRAAVQRRGHRPPKGSGTTMTVEAA